MKQHFLLQYKMVNRKVRAAGIHPLPVYVLASLAFVVLSEYGFQEFEFMEYGLVLTALGLVAKLSEKGRTDFLRTVFGDLNTKKIRILENLMIGAPFTAMLILHYKFAALAVMWVLLIVFALFSTGKSTSMTLPTPFSRRPFEFTVGFRRSFLAFLAAYALTAASARTGKFHLGVISLAFIFLVCISFYTKPENEFFVWAYARNSKSFLLNKTVLALRQVSALSLPIVAALIIFFPDKTLLTLLFYVYGSVFLCTAVFVKYAAYPREINVPESILLGSGLYFPPMLLALTPFFFYKATRKLNTILDDKN